MKYQYPKPIEETKLYDEPTDDELKRIEDELLEYM